MESLNDRIQFDEIDEVEKRFEWTLILHFWFIYDE